MKKSALQTYLRLLKEIKPFWHFLVIGLFATVLASAIDAGFTYMIKPIINHGFIERDREFIRMLPFLVVMTFLVRGVMVFAANYYIAKVGRNLVAIFRQKVFRHMLKLPASFYDGESSGQLLSKIIYNTDQISEATTYALLIIVQEGVLAIGLVVVMFSLSVRLTLLFMIITPIMAGMVRYTGKRLRRLSQSVQQSVGEVGHVAEEAIEGYRVIRTFGGEAYENRKFTQVSEKNRHRELKIVVTTAIGTSTVQILISMAIALVLFLATLPHWQISAGTFAALIAAMFSLLRPIRRINQISNIVQKGIAGAESVYELLDQPVEPDLGKKELTRARGEIAYQNVSFKYPKSERLVLNHINFHVRAGETIALVGRSGSGKSTLVSLLPRFYEIHQGEIQIDGVDIREYKLADLRHQFALVSQQVTLFNDTIAHNIAYGQFSRVTREQIIQAAEAAHAMEFIDQFPQGLETLVGENGVLLSGGQRQRIAIARALLKDAPILILDEATSALDTESERVIQTALEKLMQGRTTLVIAHRLSTIEKADRILVMSQGEIVESGNHSELIKKNGHYAKLHALQFRETAA